MKVPEISVPALLARRAAEAPESTLIEEVGGSICTSAQFLQRTLDAADAFASLGVNKGDTVAVMLEPCLLAHVCWIGTAWLQSPEMPLNPEFKGATLIHALNDCRARVLITSNALLPRIEAVAKELDALQLVITIDDAPPASSLQVMTWKDALAKAKKRQHAAPEISAPYAVIYTSGTTGKSKGVLAPWANIQYSIYQIFSGDEARQYDDPAFYSPWPTFHASGKVGLVFALERNARLVMRERLSVREYWQDIAQHRCTHTQLMGLAGLLLQQTPTPQDSETPLQRIIMNPVIPQFREFERRFGVSVSTGWGATEVGMPIGAADLPNHKTCGRLSAYFDARIVDDAGKDVPIGEAGHILLRPHQRSLVMIEYLHRPDATAAVWQDGWFRTGDVMRKDAEGWFYFVDRSSDYMRVRGHNVSSLEVELEVASHPDVQTCAAIAVPSNLHTEAGAGKDGLALDDDIKIFVLRRPDADLTHEALLLYLAERMPRYMLPRFIEFIAEMPTTPTGKVQKKALRDRPANDNAWDRATSGITLTR